MEIDTHVQRRRIKSPRLLIRESHDLLLGNSRTTPISSLHERTFSWLQRRQECSSCLTHYVETAPRGTRTRIAGSIKILVTPLKSVSPSKTRLKSSFVAGTSKTTSTTGGRGHKMTDVKKNLHARSGRSLVVLTSPGRLVGRKTIISGRRMIGSSPISTTWINDLQSNSRGKMTISLSEKVMHTSSITPIATRWSLLQ